ncbi:unnamed protein product [Protopolystoma xenopodis]|uniref:Uncharacterized protein n=1 Tax=Protopolystoma xenopodis TaxID=117903 RepID=A0A3S5CGV0_9PLAT|nr:unnamed protein product [Protopolystoma xenopodis]
MLISCFSFEGTLYEAFLFANGLSAKIFGAGRGSKQSYERMFWAKNGRRDRPPSFLEGLTDPLGKREKCLKSPRSG